MNYLGESNYESLLTPMEGMESSFLQETVDNSSGENSSLEHGT